MPRGRARNRTTIQDEVDIMNGPPSATEACAQAIFRRIMVPFETVDSTGPAGLETTIRAALLIDADGRAADYEMALDRRCNVIRPDKVACTVYDVTLTAPEKEENAWH